MSEGTVEWFIWKLCLLHLNNSVRTFFVKGTFVEREKYVKFILETVDKHKFYIKQWIMFT